MINYNKNVWAKGSTVSIEKLNNIENGISSCANAINSILNKSGFSDSEFNSIVDKKIAAHNINFEAHNNRFDLKADKSHRHNYGTKISNIEDRLSLLEEKIDVILSKINIDEDSEKEEIENAE